MLKRCGWLDLSSEIYVKYHDEEWGKPIFDDRKLFEFLILEGHQAGLSWLTILRKRETYRLAFDCWDIAKIAQYNNLKFLELLNNSGVIRNKLKIKSAIRNAGIFLEIQKEFGSFSKYLWGFVDHKPIINHFKDWQDIPVTTDLSDRISQDLKKRGMTFVGSTIIYAFLQAVGLVNNHEEGCFMK
ncbi:MAG: DNA-3-methyladenine glycosylase I [bacterium]|nr:DNA-3-methyladenine glycosylase I [bacterium]